VIIKASLKAGFVCTQADLLYSVQDNVTVLIYKPRIFVGRFERGTIEKEGRRQ
jgi:hypothetical protein